MKYRKLTEEDVQLVRGLLAERAKLQDQLRTLRNQDIAEKFGVHVRTIDRVSQGNRKTYMDHGSAMR